MISPADAAREILRRREARKSLLSFAAYTHPQWCTGEHHRKICAALEAVERGECKRLMIFAPPRHTKSELASKRFPAWYLGRNPDRQVIACSYNDELATDFGRSVRNLVGDQIYRNVFPGCSLSSDSAAAGRWHTNHGGVYISTGVGGPITGYGAHLGIIDDPFKNREEADSERIRDSRWHWYTSTFYTRLMPGGAIVMMLTRWHEDDLAARALESEKWDVLELQAISNEGTPDEQALWPEWYPLDKLRHTRSVIGPRDWSALYQQRPRAEQGQYIRREWFSERYEKAPEVNVYMASDFAVTEPREGADPDHTEHAIVGMGPDDTIYPLDWWHGQTTPDVWIDAALDLIARWKPLAWFREGGVIRRAVEPFLLMRAKERRVYFDNSDDLWLPPIHDKAVRGRAFQARAAMGKVKFPKSSTWADRVIDQCVGFPGAKHDDAFDALSIFSQAIDQAHPAIVREVKKQERDHWRDSRRRAPTERWKVV